MGFQLVLVELMYRALKAGRQPGPPLGAAGERILSEYLVRRPVLLAAAVDALGRDRFPQEQRPAARRVIVAAEAQSRRISVSN